LNTELKNYGYMNNPNAQLYPLEPTRPSFWYVVFGFVIGLMGSGLFIWFLYNGITHLADDYQQFIIPGMATIEFDEPGNYTIFHEYRSTVGERQFNSDADIQDFNFRLTNLKSGREIVLKHSRTNASYEFENRDGYTVFDFEINNPGDYLFEAWYPGSSNEEETVVAIGKGFMKSLMITIIGSIAIFIIGWAAGTAIIVITLARRKKNKKMMKAYSSGQPYMSN